MCENPKKQMAVIGTHIETGHQIYFRPAYYAQGFNRSGIKGAISGRSKSHRGYTWRYATKEERERYGRTN